MTLSETRAAEMLRIRSEAFMNADIETYMSLWSEDGVIEMGSHRFVGAQAIRNAISGAWSASRVLHFETRSFAIRGNQLLNEFAIVWKDKKSGKITLQTGMGVLEIGENGRFYFLRDYMEATNGMRQSAANLPPIRRLVGQIG
jgi:hypothetical protein